MIQQKLNNNWQMHGPGEPLRPAAVPGTVYTDLLRRGEMEDLFWKDNEIRALSLMEKDYEYVTCFDAEKELLASSRILLRFDGLDTIADIYLNGTQVGAAYNMHRIWEYDVTHILKETGNELKVLLHSPPLNLSGMHLQNAGPLAPKTPWTALSTSGKPTVCLAGTGAPTCRTQVFSGK